MTGVKLWLLHSKTQNYLTVGKNKMNTGSFENIILKKLTNPIYLIKYV